MERDHWDALAGRLRAYGVIVDGRDLQGLTHDVMLGEPLRVKLVGGSGDAA